MEGFLLIDKPTDISSFFCVKVLRRLCQEKRIGFVGTLDPLATGLMLFALGEMRKLLFYLEGFDKTYEVTIKLGATSDTYDAKGHITQMAHPKIPSYQDIEKILHAHFLGEREQQPPAFSAIQIGGKRAYDLARKGHTVVLKKRLVNFFEIKILDYSWPLLRLHVHCSSGTYIRSLAHDLGQILGCGGYVETLRRLAIGPFQVEKAIPVSDLTPQNIDSYLLQPHHIFPDAPQITLSVEEYQKLSHGNFVSLSPLPVSSQNAPWLAYFQKRCVGVLEPVQNYPGSVKFARQFMLHGSD